MKRLVFAVLALAGCRSEVDPRAWARVCDGSPIPWAKAYEPAADDASYPVAAARRERPGQPWRWSADFSPAPLARAGVEPAGKANGADVRLVVCVDHLSESVARECRMGGGTLDRQLDETVSVTVREARTARVLGSRTAALKAPPACPRFAVMTPGQTTTDERPALSTNAEAVCEVLASYLPAPVQRRL